MAKYLILYAGKTGTTAKCAAILQKKLISADLVDLTDRRARRAVDLSGYEAVVVGSNIRMGRLHRRAKEFLLDNIDSLRAKKYGIFLCCGFPGTAGRVLEDELGRDIVAGAASAMSMGGELDLKRMSPVDRLVAQMASRSGGLGELSLDQRAVEEFADAMLKALWSR